MEVAKLFIELVSINDSAARSARINELVGADSVMCRRLEELLDAHDRASQFLEVTAQGSGLTPDQKLGGEQPDAVIGNYKLLRLLGEGGMGVVYMADQLAPVRRRVALKITKLGLDNRQVIARFEAERQALAMMDHPNIAKVLDAGTTESGRPYFVMEFVDGLPITEYCDNAKMPLRQRLQLIISVCQAVQHAHTKGIIHRDLKPTNILVMLQDGVPVPRVIDFGIAKATQQPLTERTLFTGCGHMLGTPLYMSPEQAELSAIDIDTRSDIYSLGVLIYELVTGETPFKKDTLSNAGFDEMRRIIREQIPARPSDRIRTLTADAKAALRESQGLEVGQLVKMLRGELDWVVMKALEKDRRRRYETASSLAADIARYLRHEPIEACPPSRLHRLRCSLRRNRLLALSSGLIATALIVGASFSTWQAIRATNAEKGKDEALAEARLAVDEMYTQVAEKWLRNTELTELQREFLDKAARFYQRSAAGAPSDPRLQYAALLALGRVGAIHQSQGRIVEAEKVYKELIERGEKLAVLHPELLDVLVELAHANSRLATLYRVANRQSPGETEIMRATQLLGPDHSLIDSPSINQKELAKCIETVVTELAFRRRTPDIERLTKELMRIREKLATDATDREDADSLELQYELARSYQLYAGRMLQGGGNLSWIKWLPDYGKEGLFSDFSGW